jgi:hypothetical protein
VRPYEEGGGVDELGIYADGDDDGEHKAAAGDQLGGAGGGDG